jgi:hypothetical protein
MEFAAFLEYSCSLRFEEIPDYDYIIKLFKGLSLRESLEKDMVFDWDRAKSANEQPWDCNCIGQCKHNDPPKCHQGYVMFLFWTPYAYAYVNLCLGCAPRHVDVSILMIPLPPNPLPPGALGFPVSHTICICVNFIFKNELAIRVQ